MPKEKLSAFIITYNYEEAHSEEAHSEENQTMMRSIVIIAHDKKEAGNTFIKWLHDKHMYERVNGVVVQPTRKTKKNARMLTNEYYERQQRLVYDFNSDLNALRKAEETEEA